MSNSKDFPASMADNGPDNRMSLNLQTSRRSSDLVRGWDVFETTIRDHDGGDPVFYDKLMKFIKLFVLIISFGAVFIGCIVSRGSVLLMTSMISDKHMNICFRKVYHINPDNTTSAKYHLIKTDNISLSLSASTPTIIDNINTNKHTIVNDAVELTLIEERVAWLWTLFFALIFPELLTFMRCIRICLLKEAKKPTTLSFLAILLIECLVAIGLAIFEFLILPETNCIFSLLMTSSLAFFPSLINLFAYESGQTSRWTLMFNGLAFIAQIASLIVWPLYFSLYENRYSQSMLIFMPIVMVLISLRWAENYIPTKTILSTLTTKYDDLIDHLRNSINTEARYFIYLFVAPCKVIITFIILITTVWIQDGHIYYLFQNFSTFHRAHTIILESDEHSPATHNDTSPPSGPDFTAKSKIHIHLLIVYMVSSFICYTIAKFACKICVQRLGFALPLTLTCPVIMIILSLSCSTKRKYACLVYNYFPLLPEHVFWSCPSRELLSWDNQNFQILFTLWLITWLSSVWTANHIWSAPKERASKTEKLFFSPLYIGAILDQSLAFNRRRDESKIRMDDDLDKDQHLVTGGLMNMGDIEISDHIVHDSDRITRIYACATMWHETSEEMLQFLKSIMRMDEDQSARENAQKYLKIIDPDFYQFETHIMMDDAFTPSDEDPSEMVVNRYVHQLVGVVNEAASMVHKTHLKLRPPCKIPTPYGGRLIWTLPGRNKLIVHLKDKALVRVRKRWSQVMYMYYLLGHLLMDSTLHINRKAVRGENTYLLAMDGDIDFRASAVLLLVDLMKKNRNLGAACGRIHPIGTGLMVWYQKFEYAVSHWLQKATEHVFGCVLCSPGCFSLFRARALMSPNVMKRYAVQCKEPREYVQFDQGEDRWLCTLLLQSGYRVEYNAASDAYTHCPETFVEFYNQRRRWAPSTMANILDLLGDYKNVVRVNRDISYAYIVYHGFLMAGTILGPGTILLMLMGAINGVFGIDNARSLAINLFPVIIFIIICFVADKDIQLFVAQILSLLYVFLMLAVMVGTAIQAKDQPLSPSTIFFVLLISIFMIAALMHPREFSCFLSFPIYFLCIPSMYLLLTLYSLINLNVVTWGTRESTPPPTAPSTVNKNSNSTPMSNNNANGSVNMGNGQANGKLSAAAAAKANYLHLLNINDVPENSEASVSFSFGNIFKCLLCTHEPSEPTDSTSQQLAKIEDALHDLDQKITRLTSTSTHRKRRSTNDFIEHEESSETLESSDDDADTTSVHTTDTTTSSLMPMDPIHSSNRLMKKNSDLQHEHTHLHVKLSKSNSGKNRRDVNRNPRWMDDDIFKDSPVLYLSDHETTFWREMIKKYLFPLDSDKEHEKRVSLGLKELRDKVMFAVLMLNGIFIMTIYLLQSNRDKLSIRLPFRFDLAPQIEADDKSGLDSNKLMILSNVSIIRNEHHHQATSTLSPIDIEEDRVNSNLEPVGATFILFFAIILVLQVIGMLKHRLSTFSHILAFVRLDFCRRPKENINEDDFFGRNAIEIAKDLQCLRGIDEDSSNAQDEAKSTLNRQNTIFNLERKKNKHKTKTMTLDVAFKKRFLSLSSRNRQEINHLPHNLRRKQAILALERRRVSLASSESNTVPAVIGTEKPTHDSDSPPVRISQLMNHTFYQEEEEEEEEKGREQLSQYQQEYSQMSDSIENVCTENIEFKMLPGHSKRGLIPASVSFAELSADESINQSDHHQYLTLPDRLDAGGFESNSCSEASFWSPSGSRDIYHDNYGYDSDSDSKVNILKHSG